MATTDPAKLYQCTNGTKDINKVNKRNRNRFSNDFYFQLTEIEAKQLQFQTGTANKMSRTNPHVFRNRAWQCLHQYFILTQLKKSVLE